MKIGNLTVNESVDAESEDEKHTVDNSSDGESGEGGGKHSGPWKKPELPPQVPEVVEEAPPPPPPPVTTGSSYKPPHLRNIQPMAASPRQRAKNIAPDIHSEEYFPTLNSKQQQSNEPPGPWGRRYASATVGCVRSVRYIVKNNDQTNQLNFVTGNETKERSRKYATEAVADRIVCRKHNLRRQSSLWVINTAPCRKIRAEIILDSIERQTIIISTSSPLSVSWPSCAIKYVY